MPSPDTTPSSGSTVTHWLSALSGFALMAASLVVARHDTAATPPPPPPPPPATQTVVTQAATQPSIPANVTLQIPLAGAGIPATGTTTGATTATGTNTATNTATGGAASPGTQNSLPNQTTSAQTLDYVSLPNTLPLNTQPLYWRTEAGTSKAFTYLKVNAGRTPKITAAELKSAKVSAFSAVDSSRAERPVLDKLKITPVHEPAIDGLIKLEFSTTDPGLPLLPLDVSVSMALPSPAPPHLQVLGFKLSPAPADVSYLTVSADQKTEWHLDGLTATHLFALTSPEYAAQLPAWPATVLSAIGPDGVNHRDAFEEPKFAIIASQALLKLTTTRSLEAVSPLKVVVALTPANQPLQRVELTVVKRGNKATLAVMQPPPGKPALRLERTLHLFDFPHPASLTPLVVTETSGLKAQDVKVETVSTTPAGGDWSGAPRLELFHSVKKADDVALVNSPFTIEPGGSIELSPRLSGSFEVGTTHGVLRLNSPSLQTPLEVTYEVVTRLHKWVMFVTAFCGCLFGWWVKQRLNVRRDLLEQRAAALASLRQLENRGESYSKDSTYLDGHHAIKRQIQTAIDNKDVTAEGLKKVVDDTRLEQAQIEDTLNKELKVERDRLDVWRVTLRREWELASPPARAVLATIQEDYDVALTHLAEDPRNAKAARTTLDDLDSHVAEKLKEVHDWLSHWTSWLQSTDKLPLEAGSPSRSQIGLAKTAAAAPFDAGASASAQAQKALDQVADLERRLKVIVSLLPQDLVSFAAQHGWRLEHAATMTTVPQWLDAAKAVIKAASELASSMPDLITAAIQHPTKGLSQALNELKGKWHKALAFLPASQQALVFPEINASHWDLALDKALPAAAANTPPIDPASFAGLAGQRAGKPSGGLEAALMTAASPQVSNSPRLALAQRDLWLPSADRLQTLSAETREDLDSVNTLLSVITFVLYCALLLMVFPDWDGSWASIGRVFFSGFLADVSIKELLALTPPWKMPSAIPPG